MKQWRPDNWENPYIVEDTHRCPVMDTSYSNPVRDADIFEAGADAMLGALKAKENAKTEFAKEVWRRYFEPHRGTIVFIPDEG